MKNNYERLVNLLKKDTRLVSSENTLLKNEVINYANHMDNSLLKLLMSDEEIKMMFFENIEGTEIFDKQKFNWIVNSKEFLPDSYTIFSQNIGLIDANGSFLKKCDDVVLAFPNKDCFLEFDSTQEDENRAEVFFNETLAKSEIDVLKDRKVFTNVKKYDKDGEHPIEKYDNIDNLIINGNNLLVMYSLIPRYKNSIKLMYWDILYNTNNDNVPYNDSFKHSSWLVMMKNRLEVAKRLLKPEGIICLQCDKNEDAYLKVLCDEIFGRNNYINTISIKTSTPSGTKTAHKEKTIIKTKDSLLIYSNGGSVKINPQYVSRNNWDGHFTEWVEKENGKYVRKKVIDKLKENNLIDENTRLEDIDITDEKIKEFYTKNAQYIGRWTSHKNAEITKKCLSKPDEILEFFEADGTSKGLYLNKQMFSPIKDGLHLVKQNKKDEMLWSMLLCDLWTDIDFQNTQNEGNNSLPAGKKPEFLLRRIIDMFTEKGDIVLDAYLGSGTTSAVCHKMGLRYIGIEQLDSHIEKTLSRMKDVIGGEQSGISEVEKWKGGGSFVYLELAKKNMQYISMIQKAKEEQLLEIYNKLIDYELLNYRVDKDLLKTNEKEFNELNENEKRNLLMELLDKNLLYINYTDIEDVTNLISETDKKYNKSYYKE